MEIYLFFLLILAIIPARIATKKGRSLLHSPNTNRKQKFLTSKKTSKKIDFFFWYLYGVIFFLIALIHTLLLKEDKDVIEAREVEDGYMKKCEFCAELIKSEAKVCRYCDKDL